LVPTAFAVGAPLVRTIVPEQRRERKEPSRHFAAPQKEKRPRKIRGRFDSEQMAG